MQSRELMQQILAVVALIPYGKVATYGQVAKLAGLPKHARLVGYALKHMDAQADLIVIGSHGRTGIKKFFLGSVAQSVLGASDIPVLVVRK